MVQIFQKDNPKGRLAEQMGMSLGEGIGNGLNTFFANRSLESVLKDKSLEGAPASKKFQALISAASPYGDKGKELLQQYMQTGLQEMQEKETLKQEATQKKKGKALGRYLKGEDLSPEEQELFTPQEFVAMHKAKNPKPAGGVTAQPIPPDINKKITDVLNNSQGMSADQLKNSFDSQGIPPIYTTSYIENRRRESEKDRDTFTEDRTYHSKVSRPIIEEAQKNLKDSSIEKGIEQQLRRDISSGNTSGLFPFMIDKLGLESYRNPESARFTNEVKNLFIGALNEIPGARPNQFIERFLSTAQPMIGRSEEANLSVLDVADFVRDVRDEHSRLELEKAREDRDKLGYAKEDISERAWDAMGDYVNKRQEKMALDIRERHEKDKTTSDLLSEVLSGSVPPNTPLTPKMMKIFYIKNDKNLDKAIEEAEKSGFVLYDIGK